MATEERGSMVRAVIITSLALAVVTTVLRFYVRSGIVKKAYGLDDWLMLGATITYVVYVAVSAANTYNGLGQHNADIPPEQVSAGLMNWWLGPLWYDPAMAFSRGSIGIQLLRLTSNRIHRCFVYAVFSFSIVFGILTSLMFILQCRPVSYFWDKNQDGSCMDPTAIVIFMYPYNIQALFCDMVLAIIPMFIIRGWKLDRGTKVAVTFILGLALVASAAVVIRIAYIHTIGEGDFFWNTSTIVLWSNVEAGVAIITGNLAVVRPLLCKLGLATSLEPPIVAGGVFLPSTGPGNWDKDKMACNPESPIDLSFYLAEYKTAARDGVSKNEAKHSYKVSSASTDSEMSFWKPTEDGDQDEGQNALSPRPSSKDKIYRGKD